MSSFNVAFDITSVRDRLPLRSLFYLETTDSTMREAALLAAEGCAAGTAVIADEQSAGQGRHGHSWHSEKDSGLYVSVVLRPVLPGEAFPVLTLAFGLAVAETIARVTDLACDLRWPNDVMIDGRKVAGILVQLSEASLERAAAVAGIGLNVNHAALPPDLAAEATSLRLATGRNWSREDLLVTLLPTIDSFCRMLAEGGKGEILNMFCRCSSYARGKRVTAQAPDGIIEGVTDGLNPSGFLFVRRDDGRRSLILAGGVRAISAGRG
ncbi:MAG: biotin--[acetyl-CoA-carboxylase] ligase [Acidobacteria bacterium]|nr:biotin--[acetyl-CoA-carboxylase] ligase [Acidobacteriota bacterium]